MTAPQNPRVTQADREAAARHLGYASWAEFYAANLPILRLGTLLAEAFARHREAAEAASKAREAALVETLLAVRLSAQKAADLGLTIDPNELLAALTKEPSA